jgi:hypothetical protein
MLRMPSALTVEMKVTGKTMKDSRLNGLRIIS